MLKPAGLQRGQRLFVQMNRDISVSLPSSVCSEEGQRRRRIKTEAILFELEELHKNSFDV